MAFSSHDSLWIHEIFHSIQGESLLAGMPTVFVRTSGCNLRCRWCDTKYAFWKGTLKSLPEILHQVGHFKAQAVCVTGGEPLGQPGTLRLLDLLVADYPVVSLETNGSFSLQAVPDSVIKVVDVKCPESGHELDNNWSNLEFLSPKDQLKFVVASSQDFQWAREVIEQYRLLSLCPVLFSPVADRVLPADLAKWLLAAPDLAQARLQIQLHKVLFGQDARGV